MDPLLEMLKKNARESDATLAKELNTTAEDVRARIAAYEREGVIRGFQALLNTDRLDTNDVRAVIELRIRPEREGGFDRVAARIGKFPQVESMYLMSGAYDLLLIVNGASLQKVAGFVSEKLSTIEGVLSTSTHFMLRSYKEGGFTVGVPVEETGRLKVVP